MPLVQQVPFPDLQFAGRRLVKGPWIFAKTMPDNPHEYTLRREWFSETEFVKVVKTIRAYGYREWFQGTTYMMMNVNGFKHWTMGAPLSETILINRKETKRVRSEYDAIAPAYDEAFSDAFSAQENHEVAEIIGDVRGKEVLDIGCGTGLFLDLLKPRDYIGIDPSRAMLDRLKQKHPAYAKRVLPCHMEEFAPCRTFDLVVCLFGTPNYIIPSYVRSIPQLVNPGGRWVVMFYKPGYRPVTYDRTGHEVKHNDGITEGLPGTQTEFHNYVIVDGRRPE